MISNNILAEVTQDPDLQITEEQNELFEQVAGNMDRLTEQYHDDRRFGNILLRIRNFIRKLSRFLNQSGKPEW